MEERGLAGAVGADYADQLAMVHVQVDTIHGDQAAEHLAYAVERQYIARHSRCGFLARGTAGNNARCWHRQPFDN